MGSGTNADDPSPSHYIAFAMGNGTEGKYGPLCNIQCEVIFTPMSFSVSVNVTNRTIAVLPLQETNQPLNAPNITNRVTYTFNNLGSVFATTLWISVLGETFLINVINVQDAHGVSNSSTLQGVTDSLSSILDSTLGAYSSAQLMIINETTFTNVEVQSVAVVFGSSSYIYSILIIMLVIAMIYLFEALRTRGWRHLAKFNFTDVKSVVVGASSGGSAIANRAQSMHREHGSAWYATESDSIVGQLRIRLSRSSKEGIAIIIAEDGERSITPGPFHAKAASRRHGAFSRASGQVNLDLIGIVL